MVGDGVAYHDRRAVRTDAGGDVARDGVAGADAEEGAPRASGLSWRRRRRCGAGSASRKPLVVAAVVYVVEPTSQLVHVPSSETASGITTVAQYVQMQVGKLRVTALWVPTRSRERAARAIGRGIAGAKVEQGAHRAGLWSWPQLMTSLKRRASWCTSHRRRRRRVSRPSRSWYRCRWGRCA